MSFGCISKREALLNYWLDFACFNKWPDAFVKCGRNVSLRFGWSGAERRAGNRDVFAQHQAKIQRAFSAAENADIWSYDHLLSIDGQRVNSLDELRKLIETREQKELASLDLVRFVDGENRFLRDVLAEIYLDDMQLIEFAK